MRRACPSESARAPRAAVGVDGDRATVNGYVNDAYSIANGMATGSREGSVRHHTSRAGGIRTRGLVHPKHAR
jgi:hypothetical protein